jgi:TolA-binding protein
MSELREQVGNLQERVAQLENETTVLQFQHEQMKKKTFSGVQRQLGCVERKGH